MTIVVITAFHYLTHSDIADVDSHTLFRRLYYLPIAVLAVVHGVRGGGLAAIVVSLLYSPHAFMHESADLFGIHLHADPAPTLEKASEVVLYLALGFLGGFAVDVARKTQRELDEARAHLERTERLSALGRMVAGVAHEIRNPLASLHATAEMFLDDYDVNHKKHRMAQLNFEEVKRLESIVDRFLSFARPAQPRQERVELGSILARVVDLARSTAAKHQVEIRVIGDTSEVVLVDPQQLVQIFLNLILNALDASPEGSPIELNVVTASGEVCVHVLDRGPGVAKEAQEHIFEPFYTTRAQGTGLGLSIASQLVQVQGGRLTYQDRVDGGAQFCVCLPKDSPASSAA